MPRCVYRTDYKLVSSDNRDSFQEEINNLTHNGWKLHGFLIMTEYPLYARELTREVMIIDSKGNPVVLEDSQL